MKTEKIPKIRFKGFTDDWEQRELSKIATMNARIGWQNLRTSEFLKDGEYYLITGTDFFDGAIDFANCHYVDAERYKQDSKIQLKNGSILITKDGTLGKVAFISKLDKPATLNAGVFNVRVFDENTDEVYLFQYLKAPFLMDYVDQKATGGTIKHLNQNILVDFPIIRPSKEEQTAIGTFFATLDNLITCHQRKCDKLVNVKKSLLEKMFPKNGEKVPEIRFDGFTDDWEQRELGEVVNTFEYGLNAAAKEFDGQNKYLRITDIDDETNEFLKGDLTSPNIELTNQEKYILKKGDLLFARTGASVGKTYLYQENDGVVYYAGFLIKGNIKQEYNTDFVFQNTKTEQYKKFIQVTSQRSGQPGVNALEYASYKFNLPFLPEQTAIGTFFATLDNLITCHQRELEKLKNIKKSLLEKMFV